ncbi:hypothetical protein GCM10023205_82990 [Yinghuangia aomiensis]|uniref:HTH cro/C1-type domain-containing protein n=2 Tax=Yinghuangia aomiensis TaxID=676205 RepID=A0ABP9IH88_9ACTN
MLPTRLERQAARTPEMQAAYDDARAAARFGEAVYQLRTAKGWSRRQLADAAGMKQQSISRIEESASALPTLAVIHKIAKALGAEARVDIHTGEGADTFEFTLTPQAA